MYVQRIAVPIAVNGSGAQTTFSPDVVMGRILAVAYVVDGSNPLAAGADFTITGETSAIPIITITNIGTSSVTFAPRQPTCDTAGAALLYAAAGTAVAGHIALASERIKVVVAQGGNAAVGTLYFMIG